MSAELRLLLSELQYGLYKQKIRDALGASGRKLVPIFPENCDPGKCSAEIAWLTRDVYTTSIVERWSPQTQRFFDCCLSSPELKLLHLFSSGTDFKVIDELLARGVAVTSSVGASGVPLAHTAIAGMMAISRGFLRFIAFKEKRVWTTPTEQDYPPDLENQTAIVVGLGAVGREVARICKTLRMHVVGVTRDGNTTDPHPDEVVSFTRLSDMASRADWLFLACPLTNQTRGLVSRSLLDRLPTGSSLINIARGALVDEDALVDKLRQGRLRGAYLDAFRSEPLPADSPLWDLSNVIISPHNGALSQGNSERSALVFLDNLKAYVDDRPLSNQAVR